MNRINLEYFQHHNFLTGIGLTMFLAVLLLFFGIWQLYIIAAILGGFIAGKDKARRGAVVGFLGMLLAWILYLNTDLVSGMVVWDQFFEIGLGSSGLGFLGVVLSLLFGSILGAVGGYLGASIRALWDYVCS
ncbi:MAG: hypothetical protein ACE5R6_11490 [Candidatus Heimdallarchaeota archaeon]